MLRSALLALPALGLALATGACIIVIEDDDDRPRPPPWGPDAGYAPDGGPAVPDASWPSVDAQRRPDAGVIDGGSAPLLSIETACRPADELAPQELAVRGNIATFLVEHGGGCGRHVYSVCWDGAFAKSFPVQARLTVQRRGDDPCDAIVRQPLAVDLAVLREAYQNQYQTETGTVVLRFDGASARYEF